MAKKKKEAQWVYVVQDGEGYTYSLQLETEDRLRALYPKTALAERLFLSQDVTRDFAHTHQTMAPHLLYLLTQLSPEELQALGPWEFRRPNDKDELLFTWPSLSAQERNGQSHDKGKTIAPNPKPPRSAQRKAAG